MNRIVAIPLPLPHVRSVNAWLLRGDPLTLIDTGPRADGALAALEQGLRREGLRACIASEAEGSPDETGQ
jgi:glyoxylase-like metal-dependent hydrolase (beta-lactamase superfamily II)